MVVGCGQAALAIGYYLAKQGRTFLILEREQEIAPMWRDRWDSLTLFTPRRYDSLPGLEFPGDPEGYPTRAEVLAYLQGYAAKFDLPVRLGTAAKSLTRGQDSFVVEIEGGRLTAAQVVIATGPFQAPRIPAFASDLSADVAQVHSSGYRRPSDLPAGRTLVVGGGNSGYQIALELAASREAHLSLGTRQAALPQRLFGRDLFWWLTKTRLIHKSVATRIGKRMSQKELLVGPLPRRAKRLGVISHGRAIGATRRSVAFEDGSSIAVDGVVWASGFRSEYGWIDLPITDDRGRVRHTRGVTEIPGLYMLGMQWQYTRGSALLGFVRDDAAYIAEQIAARAGAAIAQTVA
ncbi:MAG: NAD(P)/FAD-dependent oxidoreductase [Acidobacteriota bacterium]